jgi:hypothetical protein
VPAAAAAVDAATVLVAVDVVASEFSGGMLYGLQQLKTLPGPSILEQARAAAVRYEYPSFPHRLTPNRLKRRLSHHTSVVTKMTQTGGNLPVACSLLP